ALWSVSSHVRAKPKLAGGNSYHTAIRAKRNKRYAISISTTIPHKALRRTAKSRIEHSQAECWVPCDVVGGGSDRQLGIGAEAMDREGGVVDCRQAGGEAGPPGVVAVLVPPSILQEVKAVFHSPMVADIPQEVRGGNAVGI